MQASSLNKIFVKKSFKKPIKKNRRVIYVYVYFRNNIKTENITCVFKFNEIILINMIYLKNQHHTLKIYLESKINL